MFSRRTAWRTLSDIEEKEEYSSVSSKENPNLTLVKWYKRKIEMELDALCEEVLGLLAKTLIPSVSNKMDLVEAKVFYIKMKGDYLRYNCEFKSGDK